MLRFPVTAALLGLGLLAACAKNDLAEAPVPLGDFRLGLNIVVADNVQKVPISREASVEEWEEVMKKAVDNRFGRYEGPRLFNIGISVDGYALAPPGIPLVAAPKSVLVVTANVWDDAKQLQLNEKGHQITVFESLSGETMIGTGLTRTKRQQMEALSYNAVKRVEEWFLTHPEWFNIPPGAAAGAGPSPDVAARLAADDSPSVAPRVKTERPPRRPAGAAPVPAAPAATAAAGVPQVAVTPLP